METLCDLPEWIEELRENLVDDSVPAHRDARASSPESSSEPQGKVVSGKPQHLYSLPEGPNCDICVGTKITKAPCRRRTGGVVPRAENVGDLITADHKVLNESRDNHRYAIVVQDLVTQWIQSYPCKTKNFSGHTNKVANVLGADEETKSQVH